MNWRLSAVFCVLNCSLFILIGNPGQPIDYRAFYNAGHIAVSAPSQVFNRSVQDAQPEAMPFYHLPHELLIFAPLSLLPYSASLLLWRAMSIGFLVAGVYLIRGKLSTAAALFAVPFCLFEGQDSCLLFFLIAASLYFLERDEIAAGALLALATFKPQIPFVIALAMLIIGRKALAAAFVATSSLIGALSFVIIGSNGIAGYLDIIRFTDPHETPSKMLSIRGLIALSGYDLKALTIGLSVLLLIAAVPLWKRLPVNQVFASAILVGSLTAFHFHAYDLVLFLIPLAMTVSKKEVLVLSLSPFMLILAPFGLTSLLAIPTLSMLWRLRVMMPGMSWFAGVDPPPENAVAVPSE